MRILFKLLEIDEDSENVLLKLIYKSRYVLHFSIVFGLVYNLLMLAMSIYSLQVLDRVISSGSLHTLLMLTIIVMTSIVAIVMNHGARTEMLRGYALWLDRELSKEIFTRSIYYTLHNRGASTSIFFRELENVKNFISGTGLTTFIDAPWAIVFLITLFFLHPVHGIITVSGAVILITLALLSERSTKKMYDTANESFNRSMMQMDIVSRNSEVVAAMGMVNNIFKFWDERNKSGNYYREEAMKISSALSNITKFFRFTIQIAITGAGAMLVLKGELTSGGMIAGSILVGRALGPFEAIVASWKHVIIARKGFEKLKNFLDTKAITTQDIQLPEPSGNIKVSNLVYVIQGKTPQQHRPIIKGMSFEINNGDVVAVIGDSAAGKSTLARLMVGILPPSQGEVTLDGADLFKWNRAKEEFSCSKYIGYLPQDIELFNGTVKANIARMQEDIDDESVIEAAKMAEVHDLILKLPEGYNTRIGVEGAALSGGQKQRIALARAFYGNPKFLVLDEPNANLDQNGEAALFRAIQKVKEKGITTVIISHRFSILNAVDKVMILRDGTILDYDTKEIIMTKITNKSGA